MSYWHDNNLEEKVMEILSDPAGYDPDHHFGRPFLTAYQVAIEFASRHADDCARLDLPVGGAGTGRRNSLAQYLARQLSGEIKAGHIPHIEGRFLCGQYLREISFDNRGETIHSSVRTLSMFRLRDAQS